MRYYFLQLAAAAAFAVNSAAGHYIFQQFATGGTKYPPWKYIRRNTNPDWLQNGPVTDLSSTDLRCNVGGQVSNGTETITLDAGDEFSFILDTPVYHAGPTSLYMSKAPGAVADYDGGGAWFKIYDWGPSGTSWTLSGTYTQRIPKCIPDGEYLLRIQQIGLHNPGAAPQFYISCAQVKVVDGGSTNPTPTAQIPGAFHSNDPGLTVNIYNDPLTNYVVPGPRVFSC
ncbi:glycoside hydrolase family 61 protein [Thermothelomyces thermophilus ATCC 42464]|uniref:lytic cellulose monooxygenase (C4-dehydrogenating) n=1 Tax=Thermothelomyces thermophilus (strain ATCC 42464 / BCRC 31852 / DSM 1799) TaxID=573729 RepID=G2Q2F7_THET4|nr:glycoside hydrolase family 61 protein [Thermothelomyces thermophilus ATCC 42464]AEO55082.1 glycoside hydrolase family 61 protein [Thermothelomyces thermophilus ATCC 42464]